MAGALAACTVEETPRVADPANAYRLLPENRGRIEAIALSLTSARRSAHRNAATTTRLVNALPHQVEKTILTNDPSAFAIRAEPAPMQSRSVEFVSIASEHDLTIWPQDPFLVLMGPEGETRLLRALEFDRADDSAMAESLAKERGYALADSSLRFEGGNIVADERNAYIGANTIAWNAIELGVSELEIAQRFEAELGLPVVVLGPLPQLVAHIDMVFTALGNAEVALADPAGGADLAERALLSAPDAVAEFERQVEAWFFGDPRIETLEGAEGKLEPPKLQG